MLKRKKISKPNEIVFGTTTRAELDQLIYGFISARIHNNMVVPSCMRHGQEGGVYSEGFCEYEKNKFGINNEVDLDIYNFDI